MNKKINILIKALERQYGAPVQISIEKPKEAEAILYTGYMKRDIPGGSLESQSISVIGEGRYNSFLDALKETVNKMIDENKRIPGFSQ